MAWLKRGYKMVDAETAIRCFADHKCNACQCEIKYLEKHPDAKAIIIGGSHIALTGYYRRVWRFFWEVTPKNVLNEAGATGRSGFSGGIGTVGWSGMKGAPADDSDDDLRERTFTMSGDFNTKEKEDKIMKTMDISGFGGDYEKACQTMLTQGLKWLAENYEPNKLKYGSYENVFGLLIAENDFSKEFDKAVCANVEPSGAMHHAVTQRIMFVVKNGYDEWLKLAEPKDLYDLVDPEREKALKMLKDLKLLGNKNPRHERCPQCKHGDDPPPHENCHDCFVKHDGVLQTYRNFEEKD